MGYRHFLIRERKAENPPSSSSFAFSTVTAEMLHVFFLLILLELEKRMLSKEQPFASSLSSKAWVLGDQFVSR